MSSSAFQQAVLAFAAVAERADEPVELLSTEAKLDQLARIETLVRLLPALRHELINELVAGVSVAELGGKLSHVLASRLRINRDESARLIHEAVDLGPRRALTGEPLAPKLEHTAAGQQAGRIGAGHVR